MASALLPPPSPPTPHTTELVHESDEESADTASQESVSLSSLPQSKRNSLATESDSRQSFARSSGGFSSHPGSVMSGNSGSPRVRGWTPMSRHLADLAEVTSPPTAGISGIAQREFKPATYPPKPQPDDTMSISSFASTSSRKARPESLLIQPTTEPVILGVALVDFNHLVGPRIEYSRGEIFDDEQVSKILPFLALPDGAHLSAEDYSYFHLVKSGVKPTTIFGISCNQQIAAADLLVKGPDVTRSTVQKAVVVLASKPVFGPIRDKLRVVTTALFHQRDFRDFSILDEFDGSLERSIRTQLTESGLYMGTSLRELVHAFRQKTLVLVKALILQKKVMFYGYPVERLCTFQYSLVSLLPGLLQTLDDCGSPPLAARAPTLSRPTSLRTADRKSMMAFMGLPLDVFGKDAWFQPYLPLQQIDMLKDTPSWLCGCTNSIITQQSDIDLLVHMETGAFEFRNQKLERSAGLTAADRKWMDDILTDVNETWIDSDTSPSGVHQFKGSDDYLRQKFEEYISAALATVKYRAFIERGDNNGVMITGGSGANPDAVEDFNPLWISEFKSTNAYEVWDRITDPLLFDLVEPRHPCTEKPSVVADLGLRLQEGIQDLKLDQQLAPAREAVARTLNVGSTNFFKAVEGVRGRWAQRLNSTPTSEEDKNSRESSPPVEVSKSDVEDAPRTARPADGGHKSANLRPFSLANTFSHDPPSPNGPSNVPMASPVQQLSAWSAGLGSFLSTKTSRFSALRTPTALRPNVDISKTLGQDGRVKKSSHEEYGEPVGSPLFNGMSPGTSPTSMSGANVPSIAGVMSVSGSSRSVLLSSSSSSRTSVGEAKVI